LLRLMRPKQWVKNAFVLAPLVFARSFRDPEAVKLELFCLALFCIASSACYVVNDIRDIERDRARIRSRPGADRCRWHICANWKGWESRQRQNDIRRARSN
jgi:4-hydroxybenzoate polyprenyltransferase